VYVTPSLDADTTYLFTRALPLCQATPIPSTALGAPRSARIQQPTPEQDHRVPRLPSSTFAGRFPSSALAVTAAMARVGDVTARAPAASSYGSSAWSSSSTSVPQPARVTATSIAIMGIRLI
jgi:hypothetical protein